MGAKKGTQALKRYVPLYITHHVLERYQKHFPDATKRSIEETIRLLPEMSVELVAAITGRRTITQEMRESTYWLSPSGFGIFAGRPKGAGIQVNTYLRLSLKQQLVLRGEWFGKKDDKPQSFLEELMRTTGRIEYGTYLRRCFHSEAEIREALNKAERLPVPPEKRYAYRLRSNGNRIAISLASNPRRWVIGLEVVDDVPQTE